MSEFTVTSGISHIPAIHFVQGDQVSWTPSTTEPTTLVYTPRFAPEQPWTAEMKWKAGELYVGRPSFDTSDYMTVEVGKNNRLHAVIFGKEPGEGAGDGELGSWTADEDPDPKGEG